MIVAGLIPALDEAASIGEAVRRLRQIGIAPVVVVDNGSRDGTAQQARDAGAVVVAEPLRGYGRACQTGLKWLARRPPDAVLFMDGDLSDVPEEGSLLVDALRREGADLVIGSRVLGMRDGRTEPGSLTAVQRFGNALTCRLLHQLHGMQATDLGPFRVVTWHALERLRMADMDFGWTVEMQVKAASRDLKVVEVPVSYRRRRTGASKVSGTVIGAVKAGAKILYTVARHSRSGRTHR